MKLKTLLLVLLLTIFPSSYVYAWLDFTKSDFCFEQPNVQNRDYVYFFPNEEVGITATSICVYEDAYGQYQSKGDLINGKENGIWTTWFEDGYKESEFNYVDGKTIGKGYWWHANGQMESEANFVDGETDGEVTVWWDNGFLKSKTQFKNGISHGNNTFWWANGQIKHNAQFKDGECIGINGTGEGWCYIFHYNQRLPD